MFHRVSTIASPGARPKTGWILLLWIIVGVARATRDCSCGYLVHAATNVEQQLYTEILETDFLHVQDMVSNPCWSPQEYNVTAAIGRGSYGKEATPANVVPNPYANLTTWTGPGILGGNAGLQLWVDSTLVDGLVPMGEIASKRMDMSYGSFRVGMEVTAVPGTCGAFFWYRNDSQEIDMEFLSSSFNATSSPVYLVMQTPESDAAGYNAAGTNTFDVAPLPYVPTDNFHEYRFDWTPHGVTFFADGSALTHMNYTYPDSPGHLSINHWSNGNPFWSQGPPNTSAVLTISYMKAYFNTTNSTRVQEFALGCTGTTEVCTVPEHHNATVPTYFFRGDMCGEGDLVSSSSGTSTTSSASSPRTSSTPAAVATGTSSPKTSSGERVNFTYGYAWTLLLLGPFLMAEG